MCTQQRWPAAEKIARFSWRSRVAAEAPGDPDDSNEPSFFFLCLWCIWQPAVGEEAPPSAATRDEPTVRLCSSGKKVGHLVHPGSNLALVYVSAHILSPPGRHTSCFPISVQRILSSIVPSEHL
jgi:hypothetical protein